jgi:hypothetical protein
VIREIKTNLFFRKTHRITMNRLSNNRMGYARPKKARSQKSSGLIYTER